MKNEVIYPLKFNPILKSTIWGGDQIAQYKNLSNHQSNIGESWELSGVKGDESLVSNGELAGRSITDLLSNYGNEILGAKNFERFGCEFPLLIKFIDAKDDLSIQVHPNDELAEVRHRSKGKTEMWYIINNDKGAKLRSGFTTNITAMDYLRRVENNTILDVLQEYNVNKGDLYFLPAGRIHSIGAGCFIAEIQQTSNITYRIYDFNRTDADGNTRELHTELSVDAIDYKIESDYRTKYDSTATDRVVGMVDCNYFTTERLHLTESRVMNYSTLDSFVIYICTEGSAVINGVELNQGETLLLPAVTTDVNIETQGCDFLITYIK